MSNELKYKDIMSKKMAQPNVPLVTLCAAQNVSYQSYNNWFKKHSQETKAPKHALKVTLRVSITEVAKAVGGGVTEIPLSIDRLISALDPDEQRQLAEELGKQQLESLINKFKANRPTQDPPGDGPLPVHTN